MKRRYLKAFFVGTINALYNCTVLYCVLYSAELLLHRLAFLRSVPLAGALMLLSAWFLRSMKIDSIVHFHAGSWMCWTL